MTLVISILCFEASLESQGLLELLLSEDWSEVFFEKDDPTPVEMNKNVIMYSKIKVHIKLSKKTDS